MFDVWMGDIELTTLILIISAAIVLPVQLLLCFKVKSRTIRLLPLIILSVLLAALAMAAFTASGWDGLGYIFLAIYAGLMLLTCGIGWGLWGVWVLVKARKRRAPRL